MSGFVFHPEALADLEEIWEFIAADSLEAADRVFDEIREVMHSLVVLPRMGHIRADLTTVAAIPASWPRCCGKGLN